MKCPSIFAAALLASSVGINGAARADQIYACVNNSSGEIKLVGQNATCKNNETLGGSACSVVTSAGRSDSQFGEILR